MSEEKFEEKTQRESEPRIFRDKVEDLWENFVSNVPRIFIMLMIAYYAYISGAKGQVRSNAEILRQERRNIAQMFDVDPPEVDSLIRILSFLSRITDTVQHRGLITEVETSEGPGLEHEKFTVQSISLGDLNPENGEERLELIVGFTSPDHVIDFFSRFPLYYTVEIIDFGPFKNVLIGLKRYVRDQGSIPFIDFGFIFDPRTRSYVSAGFYLNGEPLTFITQDRNDPTAPLQRFIFRRVPCSETLNEGAVYSTLFVRGVPFCFELTAEGSEPNNYPNTSL